MKSEKFSLFIETKNAAFEDDNGSVETARILKETANLIEMGEQAGNIRDINGNTVGEWSFIEDLNHEEGEGDQS